MARHLNRKTLSAWLEGEAELIEEHDDHINSCSRCAARLEKLTEVHFNNVEPISAEFRPALMEVLRPPEDLHERISRRISDRLQERNDASLFGSLLGVPVESTKIVLEPKLPED